MKLALLSDIHANRQAWDACMAHARAQGAEQFALLGDLVGYGADPAYVVDQAMALSASGALVLGGNHDALAVAPPVAGTASATMASQGADWTHAQLRATQREFLQQLPLTARCGPAWLVHASADAPDQWRYVDNEGMAQRCLEAATAHDGVHIVLCGHVHHQSLYYRGTGRGLMRFAPAPGTAIPVPAHRQWVATVGSVGQPRDGDPRAMYALLDTDRLQLRFERVAYPFEAAAAAIRATGALPLAFAQRLEQGR